ncbi:MAG: hypothetical protein WC292_07185 [Clostridia bacterium]
MKKIFKLILPLVLVVTVMLSFTACEEPNEDDKNPNNNQPQDSVFYDLSQVTYSLDYINPDKPEEKGFIIGDSINLNEIKYNIDYTGDPVFHIYYGEMTEPVESIEKEGDSFPSYRFEVPGDYSILIVLPQEVGAASAKVPVYVRMCGVPEERYFVIKDESGKSVSDIFVGKAYTITVLLYSDGVLIDENDERYTLFWSGVETSGTTMAFVPDKAGNMTFTFNYEFVRSGGEKYTGTAEYTAPVYTPA